MRVASPWPLHRRVVKRGFDVVISLGALAIVGLPLLVLGLAVRWSSPGPALFRQWRVGRGGRPFRIWKLRTMVDGAARLGPAVTSGGDARVTPLGRWLRKAKLDELPQLVNVLLGDMSFVGPRPEVPAYVARYDLDEREVLRVRPGITDPASIQFRDEESVLAGYADREHAYVSVLLPRKLALAREYLREQTFFGDLLLLARTVGVVVRPEMG
jgi:lipopolysaccharide/colanic/teichoic acid biosynthesis glycosyltransferase